MQKCDALFPIVFGLDLTTEFLVPIPFVNSLVLGLFYGVIGFRKIYQIVFVNLLLTYALRFDKILWVINLHNFSSDVVILFFLMTPFFVFLGALEIKLSAYFYRKLFKKLYRQLDAIW